MATYHLDIPIQVSVSKCFSIAVVAPLWRRKRLPILEPFKCGAMLSRMYEPAMFAPVGHAIRFQTPPKVPANGLNLGLIEAVFDGKQALLPRFLGSRQLLEVGFQS